MTDADHDPAPRVRELEAELARREAEVADLVAIGVALSAERDLSVLLARIVAQACRITGADAASLYVVERPERGQPPTTLRFKLARNDSVQLPATGEFTVPISMTSVAGSVAVSRRPLNLPDAYNPPADAPFHMDRSFDTRFGYKSRSMLVWPMLSHADELIGVLQLINRKLGDGPLAAPADFETRVVPFDRRSEQLLSALSAQAAVAIENAMLYEDMARAFDGFVQASVHAIEQRDPTTMGHSVRVASLTVELARKVDACDRGWLDAVRFGPDDLQELRYAALLHDFGKVGVREEVLLKAKKLYPGTLELILARFQYARQSAEVDMYRRKLELLERGASRAEVETLEAELAEQVRLLDESLRLIKAANEPTVLAQGDAGRLTEVAAMTYLTPEGGRRPLLLPGEMESLQIARGSLNAAEVREIQSHAQHTFDFLSRIPWGRRFYRLPLIAASHHEKIDGTGYPRGLHADDIPIQSKMMAVADIYDALTASDRPYKRAVPTPRALDILWLETKDRHLDADLVRLFVEGEVYRVADTAG
ncbi:MAG: GAF domain-containing protein [Deltaproteobacteria bacterium]|nr:GAF domain-containing protein [Deltaproteobacteria bacterium]